MQSSIQQDLFEDLNMQKLARDNMMLEQRNKILAKTIECDKIFHESIIESLEDAKTVIILSSCIFDPFF